MRTCLRTFANVTSSTRLCACARFMRLTCRTPYNGCDQNSRHKHTHTHTAHCLTMRHTSHARTHRYVPRTRRATATQAHHVSRRSAVEICCILHKSRMATGGPDDVHLVVCMCVCNMCALALVLSLPCSASTAYYALPIPPIPPLRASSRRSPLAYYTTRHFRRSHTHICTHSHTPPPD